jgi:hypothetical protein
MSSISQTPSNPDSIGSFAWVVVFYGFADKFVLTVEVDKLDVFQCILYAFVEKLIFSLFSKEKNKKLLNKNRHNA